MVEFIPDMVEGPEGFLDVGDGEAVAFGEEEVEFAEQLKGFFDVEVDIGDEVLLDVGSCGAVEDLGGHAGVALEEERVGDDELLEFLLGDHIAADGDDPDVLGEAEAVEVFSEGFEVLLFDLGVVEEGFAAVDEGDDDDEGEEEDLEGQGKELWDLNDEGAQQLDGGDEG